jgi:hypothetical protein
MIWGLVIALVVLAAAFAVKYFLPEVIEEDRLVWAIYFGFLILFVGAALMIGHFLPSPGQLSETIVVTQ